MKKNMQFAAVLTATALMSANALADTVVQGGIEWTYSKKDDTAKTICLGLDISDDSGRTIPTDADLDASMIPSKLTIDGEDYTVTMIGNRAFADRKLTGQLVIPATVTALGDRPFQSCVHLTEISSFGGVSSFGSFCFNNCNNIKKITADFSNISTINPGAFQDCGLVGIYVSGAANYTSVSSDRTFKTKNGTIKVVILGKMTKRYGGATSMVGANATGCKVFVPDNGYWDNLTLDGTDTEVIYYGENQELDLDIDKAAKNIVATVTTQEALVQVLEAAPLFKEHLGFNTQINVADFIELEEGAITEEMFADVAFNTLLVTFKVNTQAAFTSLLEAIPEATFPLLAIDASDATEELIVPAGRQVYIRLRSGEGRQGKYTPKIIGTTVILM